MSEAEAALPPHRAWRYSSPDGEVRPSLPEVHASIAVPQGGLWLRRLLAFAGPGYMVSVGYMDPATGRPTSPAGRSSAIRCCRSSCCRT